MERKEGFERIEDVEDMTHMGVIGDMGHTEEMTDTNLMDLPFS